MSDEIKHECGIALIRLLQPLQYYQDKYGSSLHGLYKLQLLLQKMRNRGQDGAGVVTIKLDPTPGTRYISRKRSNGPQYLKEVFQGIFQHFVDLTPEQLHDSQWLKATKPYMGEVLMGHLRYGTHGDNSIETCHPFVRINNWITRNLVLAGNFNLTNVDELFDELVRLGQYPKEKSDTVTVLEKLGHFLDSEVERLFKWYKGDGYDNERITDLIIENIDIQRVLRNTCKKFDGGYVMGGMIGHGDAFIFRDPNGIRPCFYYADDEMVAAASERPALQTALNVSAKFVHELEPGHALIIKKDGRWDVLPFIEKREKKSCSFERIYFSRGSDKDIYVERKNLGLNLVAPILEAVDNNFDETVFTYIPNTAEAAFYGLSEGLHEAYNLQKANQLVAANGKMSAEDIHALMAKKPRIEKLANKDEKLRTFIAALDSRHEMMSHVYDVTYGIIRNDLDTLVLLDDSIVRGTTMRDSIIRMIALRLKPKRIIVASSAPQIRYPDCYGIDMSKMGDFVAFKALVAILREQGKEELLQDCYNRCKEQLKLPKEKMINAVKELYAHVTEKCISKKIAQIVTPDDIDIEVDVIFQTIEGLHQSCPDHTGDWYFSGDYPTPGGNKVVNKAFVNYMEGRNERAY
ncbi:MAG: amidophosphoribosyltransferase [Saprospiraceae bacterium]|uniref:Amidophosphoribosyltransferase n=1 Tax=Candidatus Opimibacter skivensis TaxID=2982028 RepID=A0A9D7SZB2_9BACT|nr:amidophosphoribosyltransferase [Candidatus Opimibacter skivensis]